MAGHERLRASDRERDAVAERLRVAAIEGRLSATELEERLARALSATTHGDLDTLTDDLPVPPPAPVPARLVTVGWWRRFGAWAIDGIIIALITGVLAAGLHGLGDGLGALVAIAYFVSFEGGPGGAGIGKRAMGIRVVDARTHGPIGYGRAFARWLGHLLSALVLMLGYLWMLWDGEHQCWHDKLAGDLVVFADGRTEPDPARALATRL